MHIKNITDTIEKILFLLKTQLTLTTSKIYSENLNLSWSKV